MEIDFEEIQDESSDPTPTQNQDESSTAIPPQQTENGGGEKVYHLIG